MKRLVIMLVLVVILCSGCQKKDTITLKIPGTTAQIMMKLIPAGTYIMGSPEEEVGRGYDEGPQHQVTITQPFYMGIYEVTQEQWEAVMGSNPAHFTALGNPVETVSWVDCQDFITELNTLGIGTFRLPTEAEWEYACKAGTTTRFPWGDDSDENGIDEYVWYADNSIGTTHIAGQKEPNSWGLYDMHGNVYEWCSDWYADDAYEVNPQIDPTGPSTGTSRVLRGGSWLSSTINCRSSHRNGSTPTNTSALYGFRLVRVAP